MKDNSEHRTLDEIWDKVNGLGPEDWAIHFANELVKEILNLKAIITERGKEIEELKAAIKDLIPIADITFKSMARHEIIHTPNETRKEKVESIISHAKALILPLNPRHPEPPPQPSTP